VRAAQNAPDKDQKDLRPEDGACPQAGIASKTMCEDNAKKISNNSNKQVGNMLIAKDHKLRFFLPVVGLYANIETALKL
jgi:hypothetical protein